ncbi:MAG: terminase small subunit [Candidatus Shapirobacteria bacterium]|nr:terminase small subunit [Candidatus Shapirobacteria bacterium]
MPIIKYNKDILPKVDKYIEKAKEDLTKLPKVESLAIELGVVTKTIYNWAKDRRKKEFKQKIEMILALQLERLIDVGIFSKCNPAIVKMMLVKNHGFKSEVIDTNLSGVIESKFNDNQISRIAERLTRGKRSIGDASSTK